MTVVYGKFDTSLLWQYEMIMYLLGFKILLIMWGNVVQTKVPLLKYSIVLSSKI